MALQDWLSPLIGAGASITGAAIANNEGNKANEANQRNSDRLFDLAAQEQARKDALTRGFLPSVMGGLGYVNPHQVAQRSYPTAGQAPPSTGAPAPTAPPQQSGGGIGSAIGDVAKSVAPAVAPSLIKAGIGALGGGAAGAAGGAAGGLLPAIGAGGAILPSAPAGAMLTGGIAGGAGAAGAGTAAAAPSGAGAGGLLGMGALGTTAALGGAAAAVAVPWLKSQAHWEANDIVKTYQEPFHKNGLAPLVQQVNSGQLPPQQGIQQLDQMWNQYQQTIQQWAGTSSDRTKVMQQSLATLAPIIQKIRADMGGQ